MDFKIHTIKCPLKYAYSICFMFTQKTFYKKCLKIKTCFLKMEGGGIHDENITLALNGSLTHQTIRKTFPD